eukprot:scaffold109476_cov21-Phaeocystis_antarctica.AAC.1
MWAHCLVSASIAEAALLALVLFARGGAGLRPSRPPFPARGGAPGSSRKSSPASSRLRFIRAKLELEVDEVGKLPAGRWKPTKSEPCTSSVSSSSRFCAAGGTSSCMIMGGSTSGCVGASSLR